MDLLIRVIEENLRHPKGTERQRRQSSQQLSTG
jgi:hypothetical protein